MVRLRGVFHARDAQIPVNFSISPKALAAAFALLAAVTVAIGIGFASLGAWLVLPFAGLETLALAIAFFALARRAGVYGGKER